LRTIFGAAVVVRVHRLRTNCKRKRSLGKRKLAIAQRSYTLLTEKYGLAPEDIVFDPLVFPCATWRRKLYWRRRGKRWKVSALIKRALPDSRTILGIFQCFLRVAGWGRAKVVNSVFLYYCTKAGLDPGHCQHGKNSSASLLFLNTSGGFAEKTSLLASAGGTSRRSSACRRCSAMFPRNWREQSKEQRAAVKPISYRGDYRTFPHREEKR